MTDNSSTTGILVSYVYHSPHALRSAADDEQTLRNLVDADEASLTSALRTFLDAKRRLGISEDDVFVLPLTDDAVAQGSSSIARKRFRLHEIVSDIDASYASDISPIARPSSAVPYGVVRTSPVLRAVVDGDGLVFAASDGAFARNFAAGSRLVLDTPVTGRTVVTATSAPDADARLGLDGWPEDKRPESGTETFVTGIEAADPSHVRSVRAFHDWRVNVVDVNAGETAGDGSYEDLTADVSSPAVDPGPAVSEGSVAISGTDASGTIYASVVQPGPRERSSAVLYVMFTSPHATAPAVSISAANANAANLVPMPYVDASTTGFVVRVPSAETALAPATTYAWSYIAKASQPPIDRRPVTLADFNEGLYRLLYSPTDDSMATMTTEALFENYLEHPERIACERDMAKITGRAFDVTIARTVMSIARGAMLTFQEPFAGAVSGVAGVGDVLTPEATGDLLSSGDADKLVPTLATVLKLLE